MSGVSLVWFRQDLRLSDNPALTEAAARGNPIAAVFILDDQTPGEWKQGGASRWWLHFSLDSLARDLDQHGLRLILRRGPAQDIIPSLANALQADAIFWNRCYDPAIVARDTALKERLKADGREVHTFNALLLHEPDRLKTGAGTPFKVFTPFYRALKAQGIADPLTVPPGLAGAPPQASDALAAWKLLPTKPDWAGGLRANWIPGETEARKRYNHFVDVCLKGYAINRNLPDGDTTSRLSPRLHHGELSPRQLWHAVRNEQAQSGEQADTDKFLSELAWREFAYYNLYHFPSLPEQPMDARYRDFPYLTDDSRLKAWQRGRTGYPVIDAAMRQLWQIGWMHNRMRLATSSFLVKHLGISWHTGTRWFWDTLIDADLANNALGWQWIAGCGPDAAPYFRIFNPIIQGQKFDPDGGYVREYVPELARLPKQHIHTPWLAPAGVLKAAGVTLGETYPYPVVDHAAARAAALARSRRREAQA